MNIPGYDEINEIAKQFIILREKAKKTKSKKIKKQFKDYQNFAVNKLSHLVLSRTSRYKNFSNYYDLTQDGFEALILSLKTYDPSKGNFIWWAKKYINTRISRAANAHSTIRYPIKKAKELPPYKVGSMPLLIDENSPYLKVSNNELYSLIHKAIEKLPLDQKKIISLAFDFEKGNSLTSISSISKQLKISRNTCLKMLEEAKNNIKDFLNLGTTETV